MESKINVTAFFLGKLYRPYLGILWSIHSQPPVSLSEVVKNDPSAIVRSRMTSKEDMEMRDR